jgi:hypothetical protein
LGRPTDRDFLLFIEEAIKSKYPKFLLIQSHPEELKKKMYSFKNKDSCGYDEISLKFLKLSTPYISLPFNYIYNRILQSGTFPERLKYYEVKPLHKKGDNQLMSNYRPISLLTSFSKTVERLIFNRLMDHPNECAIRNPSQYGFQKTFPQTAPSMLS